MLYDPNYPREPPMKNGFTPYPGIKEVNEAANKHISSLKGNSIGPTDTFEVCNIDVVNSPPHYCFKNGMEVLNIIQELLGAEKFTAYCEGNVIKYVLRARKKGHYLEDMKKAQVYLNKLVEVWSKECSQDPPF